MTRSVFFSLLASSLLVSSAWAGEIIFNSNSSDPAPKKAFEDAIAIFESENPDIKVTFNVFAHEGFKTSLRNFLSADSPDIVTWFAANRMRPYVESKLFAPIDDVWQENELFDLLSAGAQASRLNGQMYAIPLTYYQWGVYYRKDIFAELGISIPSTWDEFVAAGEKLKAAGITPITIGTKFLWTAAGVFDYLNLRTNGYDFHVDLTSNGTIPWTDPRVRKTFAHWKELIDAGFFLDNHASYAWQEALPFMVNGEAAMYVMGNFAVAPLREAGLSDSQLGFFQFPVIDPSIPLAEDAPMDTIHLAAKAKNPVEAKKFLAFMARADIQTMMNKTLNQLPINRNATPPNDVFTRAGFQMLNNTDGRIAQFFDRDAPADMAKAGMEGFQEFMVKPERLEAILKRLEKVRQKVY